MAEEHELEQSFTGAVNALTRHFVVTDGTVVDVDTEKFTVNIQVGDSPDAVLFNVPIKVLKGSQASVIAMPKIGSACTFSFRDGNMGRPQLVDVDQVQDFYITTAGNTIFNAGTLGGMVKARELQTQSNLDKEILQAMLDILTGPPIDEPGNGAPSALQIALRAALIGKSPGTWDNLENPKITQ